MELLKERIRKDGVIKEGNVLKVDSFLNHQMDIQNGVGRLAQRLDNRRADGQVRDKVAVHAVDMDILCAGIDGDFDVSLQICKISGQNRRR